MTPLLHLLMDMVQAALAWQQLGITLFVALVQDIGQALEVYLIVHVYK